MQKIKEQLTKDLDRSSAALKELDTEHKHLSLLYSKTKVNNTILIHLTLYAQQQEEELTLALSTARTRESSLTNQLSSEK